MKKASFLLGAAGCAVVAGALALFVPGVAQTQSYSSPMRDVDNPARQPINLQAEVFVSANAETGFANGIYTVPAGKRLIIDYICLYNTLYNAETALMIAVTAGRNGSATSTAIAPLSNGSPYADANGFHPVTASQQVSMFANPGDQIDVEVATNGGAPGAVLPGISITGYLVNLP